MVSEYAKNTVDKLVSNGLYRILSVSEINVFHNVGVYPIILHGDRSLNTNCYDELYAERIEDVETRSFKRKKQLANYSTFSDKGIKFASGATGFQAQLLKNYITDGPNGEKSIPFIVSGSVDPYSYDASLVRYMKNAYKYPHVIQGEGIADSKWSFWLNPKVVVAGMTKVIESVYIDKPMALGVGIYAIYDFAGYNPKSLSALLNSTFMTNYMTIKFKEKHLAGGYLAINKNTLEKLPLVDIPQEIQDTLAQYYDEIVKRKVEGLDITSQLAQIDEIVDTLFENSED